MEGQYSTQLGRLCQMGNSDSDIFEAPYSEPLMFKRRERRVFHVYLIWIEKATNFPGRPGKERKKNTPSSAESILWSFLDLDSKCHPRINATWIIKDYLFFKKKRDMGWKNFKKESDFWNDLPFVTFPLKPIGFKLNFKKKISLKVCAIGN